MPFLGGSFNALMGAAGNVARNNVQAQQANALASYPDGEGYGTRPDGTQKGRGYLGEVPTPDGQAMTEYSIGIDFGQGEMDIPTLVPTLTPEERDYLARTGEPTDAIVNKAVEFAQRRLAMGLSPFAVRGFDYGRGQ